MLRYRFKSEIIDRFFSFEVGDTWNDMNHWFINKSKMRKNKSKCLGLDQFIGADLEGTLLDPSTRLDKITYVIVSRLPPVAKRMEENIIQLHGVTEEERLQSLISKTKYQTVPTNYLCHYCGLKSDHFIDACPQKKNPFFLPMWKRKLPSGFPMSNFRIAKESERKDAFVSSDQQYYVWK